MNKISSVFSQYLSAPMIDSVAQGKVYNIKVNNYNMKNSGVRKITLNGYELKENKIYLIDNGKINNIEIFL